MYQTPVLDSNIFQEICDKEIIKNDEVISFRLAKAADLDDIILLNNLVFGEDSCNRNIQCWYKLHDTHDDEIIVAIVGDRIVGFAQYAASLTSEYVISFGNLAVHPDYRKKGIGTALVMIRALIALDNRPNPNIPMILELSCYDELIPYHALNGFRIRERHRPDISCIMSSTDEHVFNTILSKRLIKSSFSVDDVDNA